MKLSNLKVVVTGGAGFIGSHLVDALLARGSRVLVVDDFSTGKRENLSHHSGNSDLGIETLSVMDEKALHKTMAGADVVFHLATQNVRLSLRQPTIVHEVNTTGTLNVLKAAAGAKVQRFLYCSSSEVYGTAVKVPQSENAELRPETIYGASKLTGEYYTQVFQRSGWLNTVIARPYNSYGPREHYEDFKGEVIPRFILSALSGKPVTLFGDGAQTRDFTYVTETVEMLCRLVENDAAVGNTYNVCHGQEVSIREIATLILELTKSTAGVDALPSRPSDVLRLFGDSTRVFNLTGMKPETAIREGLALTIEWFKKNVPLAPETLSKLEPRNWASIPKESWMPG